MYKQPESDGKQLGEYRDDRKGCNLFLGAIYNLCPPEMGKVMDDTGVIWITSNTMATTTKVRGGYVVTVNIDKVNGRLDLLTTLTHEYAHIYYKDCDTSKDDLPEPELAKLELRAEKKGLEWANAIIKKFEEITGKVF
jgi:hypothetical protein